MDGQSAGESFIFIVTANYLMEQPTIREILIVDNQPIFIEGIAGILQNQLNSAIFHRSASYMKATDFLYQVGISVAIVGIEDAACGGFEFITKAKAISPTISVLALSSLPINPFGCWAIKAGASGYLSRSSLPDELVAATNEIMAGRKYIGRELGSALAEMVSATDNRPAHETLSAREMHVMVQLALGQPIKTIAFDLSLSPKTVSTYRGRIFAKLGLSCDADLFKYVVTHQFVEWPKLNSLQLLSEAEAEP